MGHEGNGGPGDRLERIERELARLKAKVEDEGGKDRWDKAQIIVGTIGALLIPLAVAFAGT